MSNIIQLSKLLSVKDDEKVVISPEKFKEYLDVIREVTFNSASLTFDDLVTAVSVASFYSQQMKKRIDFLEGQMENDWK